VPRPAPPPPRPPAGPRAPPRSRRAPAPGAAARGEDRGPRRDPPQVEVIDGREVSQRERQFVLQINIRRIKSHMAAAARDSAGDGAGRAGGGGGGGGGGGDAGSLPWGEEAGPLGDEPSARFSEEPAGVRGGGLLGDSLRRPVSLTQRLHPKPQQKLKFSNMFAA